MKDTPVGHVGTRARVEAGADDDMSSGGLILL